MSDGNRSLAELASEYWKLLRAFERSISLAPESAKARLNAQARYSEERLKVILNGLRMKIVSFDGAPFEVNLPVTAINAEDVNSESTCVVERTIEPAVLLGNEVVITGKVFVVEYKATE